MPSRWIEFIKQWASDHGISYGCALSDKNMSAAYHKTYNTGKYKNDTSSQFSYQTAMEEAMEYKPKKPKRKLIIVDEEEILEAPKPKKYIRKLDRKLILEGSTPKPKQPKRMLIIEEDEPAPKPKKATPKKPKRQLIIEDEDEVEIPEFEDWMPWEYRANQLDKFSEDRLRKQLLDYGYKADKGAAKKDIIFDLVLLDISGPLGMLKVSKAFGKNKKENYWNQIIGLDK